VPARQEPIADGAGSPRVADRATHAARHGVRVPRGQSSLPGSRGARFGEMFPHVKRPDVGKDAVDALAEVMRKTAGTSEHGTIPAGYTYLGQFIDHDITFDPTSKIDEDNDPDGLVNFRTPRLDLDSLYGTGPVDQPFLYEWEAVADRGVKLLVGRVHGRSACHDDLPRNEQGRALLGDARNDENLIVSQLHLVFIQFHNAVVDWVRRTRPEVKRADVFETARRLVRWHYQWVVVNDFLDRVAGKAMMTSVLGPGSATARPAVSRRCYTWEDTPAIPVEFSGAAYRFGHSMVRNDYTLNETPGGGRIPIFRSPGEDGEDLIGFRRLPTDLKIEWDHLFKTGSRTPLPSMQIDASLAPRLAHVPPDGAALAHLNLRRHRALRLPPGSGVATALGEPPLEPADLVPAGAALGDIPDAVLRSPPLWYYVLCEAKKFHRGNRLGPVGGRIVAEVLVGLLEADRSSYLNAKTTWSPELPRDAQGRFTMAQLVRFATGTQTSPPPGASAPPG